METMIRDAAISFPFLGDFVINPPASFTLFGREFYFYGLITAIAVLSAVTFAAKRAPRFGIESDQLYDLFLWIIPIGIIGCRVYFVACSWDYYRHHLDEIIKIWNGGIAMYGGIIFGSLTALVWARIKKIPAGAIFDIIGCSMPLGASIGRWANFINREAFGYETDFFMRMGLTKPSGETIFVHPTFLYESIWSFIGFIFLFFWINRGKRRYDGQAFIIYIGWYGAARALIEGFRTDSLYLFGSGIRASQLVGILSVAAAAILLLINSKRTHKPMYVETVKSKETEASLDDEESNKYNK